MTLTSLISDHYGGADRDTADHVERFYFTRELGGTRWERWQNTRERQFGAAVVAAGGLVRGDRALRCGRSATGPRADGTDRLPRMDAIVPPSDPAGDPPGFRIDAIRTRPETPAFFLKSGPEQK